MLPPGRGRRRVEPEVYAERVPIYDYVAESYDDHFARPVDRWEDERLAALLAPHVNGADVLDLGCGTGWVLDHLSPAHYIGVDASPGMLAVLHDKHPDAWTACLAVGSVEWKKIAAAHVEPVYDAAVATWAAHCFGDLQPLLADLEHLVRPGGSVLLHGQGPRYERRGHYVLGDGDPDRSYRDFTVDALRRASEGTGATLRSIEGTGALPDRMALSKRLWRSTLRTPTRFHYAYVAHWTFNHP